MQNRILADGSSVARCWTIKSLLLGTSTLALAALPAFANPLGGTVTTGSAAISAPSPKTTNVNQKSEGVVIDWSSFNIGSGQTTNFLQPNRSAIAVNRIGGANASNILGTLNANGRVVLINGNGILFGRNAQVNVGSLVATSTDGSDADVLAGKYMKAGNQNASIINRGDITAAARGTVALVAPNVTNRGTIEARLGTVSLGGANAFTVDFKGDGLVSFATQGDVNAAAKVVNTGKLVGANVAMTAHAAEGVATGVVNTSGIIEATGVHGAGGAILLDSGNGALHTAGNIDAAGKTGGGNVETSGQAVSIAGKITAGKGGNWTVDPQDLTIDLAAATSIDGALSGGTNVTEQTTSTTASGYGNASAGNGDIFVDNAISWNTSAKLTLDAYHSLNILAPITVTGAGNFVLQYNDANTDGTLSFGLTSSGFAGSVNYGATNNGGTLTVNGAPYTLLYSMTDVQNINNTLTGNFALATPLDATSFSGFIPLGTDGAGNLLNSGEGFTGNFDGLGNTISHLTINDSTDDYVGLFGYSDSSLTTIRDLALSGGSVTSTRANSDVGALVGDDAGLILNVQSNLAVSGTEADVGGVVGVLTGTIENASSSGNIIGDIDTDAGGLVGYNDSGEVLNSSASGTVNATSDADAGGLVGYSYIGTISGSWATGAVTVTSDADAGGLVGYQDGGSISGSYATGTTSAGSSAKAGGLAGYDDEGAIDDSHATGAVTASSTNVDAGGLIGELFEGTIQQTYATGTVTANNSDGVGGLVGQNSGTIEQSFADGAVTGDFEVGGLVGDGEAGSIADSYAMGAVHGNGEVGGLAGTLFDPGSSVTNSFSAGRVTGNSFVGGLVGSESDTDGVFNSYWDTQTSGQPSGGGGATAATTAQLQAALDPNWSTSTWKIVPGVSYPYLTWQSPSSAPQVIAGTVTSGASKIGGQAVSAYVDGSVATPLAAMWSGADGYYYLLMPTATISGSGSNVFAYLNSGTATGNAFVQGATHSQTALGIDENELRITSSAGTASSILSAMNASLGGATGSQFIYTSGSGFAADDVVLTDSASTFDVDTTIDTSASYLKLNVAGTVTESTGVIDAKALSVVSQGSITLGGANSIVDLEAFSTSGPTGDIDVNDETELSVNGKLNAGFGSGTVTLSAYLIGEGAAGVIDAGTLDGSSVFGTTLNGNNNVKAIGNFTIENKGYFRFTNDKSFVIDGTISASSASSDVDLTSAGRINETGDGQVDTAKLFGSSVGGAILNGNNAISDVYTFTNTGAGGFQLTDTRRLAVAGAISAGTGNADITVTNGYLALYSSITADNSADITVTNGNIALYGGITADNIRLVSDLGQVRQAAGVLAATGKLTVDAYDNITLDDDNTYTTESLHSSHGVVHGH